MRDDEGFEAFYAAHHAGVWAYLLRLGATHAMASDLTQDAFVRWLERDAWAPKDVGARAYLYRIAQNLYVDQCRRQRRETAWDDGQESAAADDAEPFPTKIWARLPQRQRQLLWLAYAEGFSHGEIAAITGLAADGIRVLLSRARAKFQQLQNEEVVPR